MFNHQCQPGQRSYDTIKIICSRKLPQCKANRKNRRKEKECIDVFLKRFQPRSGWRHNF